MLLCEYSINNNNCKEQIPAIFRVLFDVGDTAQNDGGRLEGFSNFLKQRHRRVCILKQPE